MTMKKTFLIVIYIFISLEAFAQVDTKFWFAVPSLSEHCYLADYHLMFSAYDEDANVRISMPASPSFVPKTFSIAKNSFYDYVLAADYTSAESTYAVPYHVISQRGLLIESDAPISCYFQITMQNGEAYTLKGDKALGTDFVLLMQNGHTNGTQQTSPLYTNAYSSLQIVATEDNTSISIHPSANTGVLCNTNEINITLNRGETYALRACDKAGVNHIAGSVIHSNKPIAVNSTDDTVRPTGGKADLAGDQLVPIDYWDTEYIAVSRRNSFEGLYIFSCANTIVTLGDGTIHSLNAGEVLFVSLADKDVEWISSTEPIGIYHLTGINEVAGTILPGLHCTGSKEIFYKRQAFSVRMLLHIVIRTSDTNSMFLNDSPIASSNFHIVNGTGGEWSYAKIEVTDLVPLNSSAKISNSSGLFQLGIMDFMRTLDPDDNSVASCTYGYFSNYGTGHEYDEYDFFEEGTTYIWKNHFLNDGVTPLTFSEEGIYRDTIYDMNACDSICILNLKKLTNSSKCYSTEGTEFYVAFMPNGGTSEEVLTLFASSRYNATMTISNPNMGWSTNITIPANGVNSITLPNNYCFTSQTEFEQVLNKGLIVTSTAPISLFASNALEGSHRDWDAANILPAGILSSKYILQTIAPTNPGRSVFAIMAVEDETTIDINLTAPTSGGHNVGEPYQISLNKGQIYMCYGSSINADFSGTLINSYGKKIAVYNGANQTCIPSDKKAADHLFEQAIPIEALGSRFAITGTRERQRDLIKITAVSNSTDVYVNGIKVTTLNARQSHEFKLETPNTSCYVETSNPVVCNLYLMSHSVNNQFRTGFGDPAMVAIYPIEQTTDHISFSTVSTSQTCEHYVNLITTTNNINNITLDGANIAASFELLNGNDVYSFARIAITEGKHTVSSSETGFLGHVYGMANVESYAYNLGTTICELNDYNLDGDTTKLTICEGEDFIWNGITPTVSGLYNVNLQSIVTGFDSICILDLTINPTLTGDTIATFCNGHPFKWHGVDYSTAGDYPYTYTSKVTGCDSIVTLHLTQLEPTDSIEVVTICAGASHVWHEQTFTSTTTISETIDNAVGCDSVCTLKLTVLPALTGDTAATFCNGSSYTWHGVAYGTAGNYPYTCTSKVAPYCDSTVTLHLTQLEPTDSIEIVTICAGETHTWHGQTFTSSATKTETINNSVGCDSVCTLKLTVLPALTGDTVATFCNGHPFKWHGVDYSTAGDYPYTYTSKITGCDSIVTLHLSQLEPTDSVECATICEGDTYTWHGHTYTSSTDITETIDNAVGCDSVCTLHLTVNPKLYGDTAMTVCDTLLPVVWRGQTISSAGSYYYMLTGSTGCDSIVTLAVTVETCLPPIPPTPTCDTLQASLIVSDICADNDSMYIDITYTDGLPVAYNITFGSNAVAQGFQASYSGNVRITSSTTATIAIAIPNDPNDRQKYPRPNTYKINISLSDTCDTAQAWLEEFLIHYPSWLTLQRWNDVISMYNERYNGGYVFSTIRWYHEGSLLESHGDHDGYIYERPHLIYGDAYWAELTRADDGVTITTCPIYPVSMTDSTNMDNVTDPYIIVTPTVVPITDPYVTVQTNICGEYYMYYVDGYLLDKQPFCPPVGNSFKIDIGMHYVRAGQYILVFYGEEGTIKAVKLLLEP